MASEIVSNIIILLIAIGFAMSIRLSDKPKYFLYGSILTAIGAIRLLNYNGFISLEIPQLPIIVYAVNIVSVLVGGGLIKEAIRAKSVIRWSSLTIGVAIVLLTVVPTLYGLNAITFNLPSYPGIINYYLHVSAGFLLLLGIIIVRR